MGKKKSKSNGGSAALAKAFEPPAVGLDAEEMAQAEREQEEEDLAELKAMEADEEQKRRQEGIKLIERDQKKQDEKSKKKSSKDRFKDREVSHSLSALVQVGVGSGRETEEGGEEGVYVSSSQEGRKVSGRSTADRVSCELQPSVRDVSGRQV